ncbi:MAG: hypothetical protein K2L87_02145 [Clostridiales bacterium]|nr:hypothetical protein [Clostridiales bacterium]
MPDTADRADLELYMNKVKIRFISIFALAALILMTLAFAFGAMAPIPAGAASTHNPDSVFTAGSGGQISASEAAEGADSFVQFKLENEGKAHFRRDLALKWYEEVKKPAEETTEGEEKDEKIVTPEAKLGYFNITFAFPEVNFEKFTLTFVSAQESVDKEEKTTNSLIFTAKDGALALSVKHGDKEDAEEIASGCIVTDPLADITVSFTQVDNDDKEGAFTVLVNNLVAGKFTNIGGYYMEYSTSRDPLTFTAEGGALAAATDAKSQIVLVKEMNNQSFKLTESGMVSDDTDPVLVVNEVVTSFPLGQKFSLACKLIDVCGTSRSLSTITSEYYMYKAPAEGEEAVKPEYKSLSTSTYFMPVAGNEKAEREYVSIRFRLDDGRTLASDEVRGYAYLSWYVDSNLLNNIANDKQDIDYILVTRNNEGPKYTTVAYDSVNDSVADTSDEAKQRIADYQAAVEEASKDLNAGSGAYFYLPSLRDLITDDNTDYRNLKFTVYYKDQTSSSGKSTSSLDYNKLRIEISKKGSYAFRVVATDKLGNGMQLMDDGAWVSINSSNVWDYDCIPQFEFVVHSKGAEIEKPDAPAKGYLDGTYTVDSFKVVAVDGYKSEYKLYYFEQDKYIADGNTMPSYDAMVENPEQYAVDKYMTEIREYDDTVGEDDAAWDKTDNDYYWRPSSRTFRPQKTGYYFVKIEVTDVDYFSDVQTAYQVVEVSNNIDEIKGETYWLENNITAVVLFAISGVLLIALVVLIFVKPSDKKVEEVDLNKLKGKKKNKK